MIPEPVKAVFNNLYYYQKESVNWVVHNFLASSKIMEDFEKEKHEPEDQPDQFSEYKAFRGLMLGHEPGLGKTPITCVILNTLFTLKQIRFALLVLPKTLIPQWIEHLNYWCPGVSVLDYQGPQRLQTLRKINKLDTAVVVTTYRTAVSDAAILQRVFKSRQTNLLKKSRDNKQNSSQ